jgi:2-C-methyl-D-erythritol 4-phosphate cytidylyltransferase
LIHDGVRPFLTQKLLKRLIDSAFSYPAQIAAIPAKDTIKTISSRCDIIKTLNNRKNLWHAQTPQIFSRDLIIRAYKEAYNDKFFSTDDAALVERLGFQVKIIEGEVTNIKITTPFDLLLGETILKTNYIIE